MSLDQVANLAQIIGSIGVVISLVFVGLQVRQNTAALYRNEHNHTMQQWTVIRMAITKHREVADLMTAGLRGESVLDAADQLRLEQFLQENLWAAFHIWDREQRAVFPKGTFAMTGGALAVTLLVTPRGAEWWREAKKVGFLPAYVAAVDDVVRVHLAKQQASATGTAVR